MRVAALDRPSGALAAAADAVTLGAGDSEGKSGEGKSEGSEELHVAERRVGVRKARKTIWTSCCKPGAASSPLLYTYRYSDISRMRICFDRLDPNSALPVQRATPFNSWCL